MHFLFLLLLAYGANARVYQPMEDLNQIYYQEVQGKSGKALQTLSLKDYNEFVAMETNTHERNSHYNVDSGKPTVLTKSQAEAVLQAVERNPVVSSYAYTKYDPYNQGIGFCFGRAMFADLYLSMNGLNRASIKKAFAVGPMIGDQTNWGWHVATIVQSVDSTKKEVWLAIDNFTGRVMDVRLWYKALLKMSPDGKLRLYITDAGKFGASPSRYDEVAISDRFYNNYFKDMLKWFENN